jgi:hypothetical protein
MAMRAAHLVANVTLRILWRLIENVKTESNAVAQRACATQAFAESAACPGFGGAPRLTEFVENTMRAEKAKTMTNPHRMAITRIMDILPRQGEIAIPWRLFYRFRVSGV